MSKRYLFVVLVLLVSLAGLAYAEGGQVRGENAGLDPVDPPQIRLPDDPADGSGGEAYSSPAVDDTQVRVQNQWKLVEESEDQ